MTLKRTLLQLLLAATLLAGATSCNALNPAPTPMLPTPPPATAQPSPKPTTVPTALPPASRVVLVAPPEAGTALAEEARAKVSELAEQAQMTSEVRPSLKAGELPADTKVVVLLAAPTDLAELAASAPAVQFVAVASSDEKPATNLSIIHSRADMQAFLAGYLATIIAPDWRSVGLLPADEPNGPLLNDAFTNGGQYWCGRCAPQYPPLVLFPLVASLPTGSDLATWQGTMNEMQKSVLQVAYIAPQVSSPELLNDLAGRGFTLIGGQTPPDALRSQWAATIAPDILSPVEKLWPDLIAGKGGQEVNASLNISDVNDSLASPGRVDLAKTVLQGLVDGTIDPLTPPTE